MSRSRRGLAAAGALLAAALPAPPAHAHQPRIVGSARLVHVSDPEVSKAFYARLPGTPARYVITSPRRFALYAQMTVPDVRGAHRDWRMDVLGPDGRLASRRTPAARWKPFFEPFGGDHYLTGPEFRRTVPAGRYAVVVSRPGNRGAYVLAIGEAETWNPAEAVRALAALPEIKRDWFGQSAPRAWLTRTVPVTALLLAITVAFAVLARRLLRRRRRA